MKNKAISIISALFGLMLIGVILIQYGWIRRVDALNQKAFNDAIYKALGEVVRQVSEKENFSFIKHEISGDTFIKSAKNFKVIKHSSGKEHAYSSVSNTIKVSVSKDSGKRNKTIIRVENDKDEKKTTSNSIVVGTNENIELPEPPQPPMAPKLPEAKIEDVEILVRKMSHIKNADSLIVKPSELEKIIEAQLRQNNLPEKFTFALLSKNPKKSYVQFSEEQPGGTPYRINLYPNDLFGREITLVLFLSPKDVIAGFKEQFLPQALSLFFTLSLLILFIYSIRMLLRHKKMLVQKNDFINHMSHEFKTPLAGISLGADMLLSGPEKMSSEQIHRVANIIKQQSTRLDKEVTGVLLSAQLEENSSNTRGPFNLVDVLKIQLDLFSLQVENKVAKISTHFSEENIVVNGDESLWQKVFSNLLDNALKFSNKNPEITISIARAGDQIKIEFSDNGIGIAEKDLPHIFEKFYRSNFYMQSNIQGFGLGLNFVKKVADSHKGIIKAESELGKGTKITLEINA